MYSPLEYKDLTYAQSALNVDSQWPKRSRPHRIAQSLHSSHQHDQDGLGIDFSLQEADQISQPAYSVNLLPT